MKLMRLLLISFLIFTLLSAMVSADEERLFTGEIVSEYEFGPYTYASVNHTINIVSVQGEFAPTEYQLNLGEDNLIDAIAEVQGRAIDAEFTPDSVKVNFPEELQNQTNLSFNLKYKSEGVVVKQGLVREVTVPVITGNAQTEITKPRVRLLVPREWGSLQSTSVSVFSNSLADDMRVIEYEFESGNAPSHIRVIFGEYQLYRVKLTYHLHNVSEKETSMLVTFPPNLDPVQTVYVEKIDPKPDEITTDADNNVLGHYWVKPGRKLDVVFNGAIKIDLSQGLAIKPAQLPLDEITYTLADQYWEANAPEIIELAQSLGSTEKIYRYVSDNLTYDYNRVTTEGVSRYGALQALQNRGSAVCMEFTDLTIALLRAAGIPAREVDGYAVVNEANSPVAGTDVLHAWVQYYDESVGWVNIDPTWESITGFDYFNQFDTEHVALAIKGITSQKPQPVGVYRDAEFTGNDIVIVPTTEIAAGSVDVLGWIDKFNYDQLNIFEKFWLWLSRIFN